ncbi:MAG TPA: hypothetical protein VGQ48_11265 [Gemmatimonadales bacterium]|nr:hypothetical protein [Gemmatimonadales bacterium]
MYCRSCEARLGGGAAPSKDEAAHPGPIWGASRISGLRCGRCGTLMGADDIAQLLLEKQSQLEQFGLLRPPTPAQRAWQGAPRRALRVIKREKD